MNKIVLAGRIHFSHCTILLENKASYNKSFETGYKNISIQMLKDIGMVVPKIIETRFNTNVHISTYACAGRQQ